jgi:hypothetical protein
MRYQKIHSQIWNDEKFIQLTPQQQRLFFYILTCPHGNLIGLYVLKEGYAREDLKSFGKDFRKDLTKLIDLGLIEYDNSVSVVFIKNFLKHNPITNPNQVKAADKTIKELPKTYLIQRLKGLIKGLNEVLLEVLLKPEEETETETEEEAEIKGKNNGFDVFWKAYPKRIGKGYAKSIWMKIKPDDDLLRKMLLKIEVFKEMDQWKKEGGQFIPYPATWLNQGRWEDEVELPNDQYSHFEIVGAKNDESD